MTFEKILRKIRDSGYTRVKLSQKPTVIIEFEEDIVRSFIDP